MYNYAIYLQQLIFKDNNQQRLQRIPQLHSRSFYWDFNMKRGRFVLRGKNNFSTLFI
jgi:hypothetical protein